MYPDPWSYDPLAGPPVPEGFRWWFALIVIVAGLSLLFLSGCDQIGAREGDIIFNHCQMTAGHPFNETVFQKCVDDSIFVLDTLQKG